MGLNSYRAHVIQHHSYVWSMRPHLLYVDIYICLYIHIYIYIHRHTYIHIYMYYVYIRYIRLVVLETPTAPKRGRVSTGRLEPSSFFPCHPARAAAL